MLPPCLCVNIKGGDKEAVMPLAEHLSECMPNIKVHVLYEQ